MARRRKILLGDVLEVSADHVERVIQVVGFYNRAKCWSVRLIAELSKPIEQLCEADVPMLPEEFVFLINSVEAGERDGTLRYLFNAGLPERFQAVAPIFRANLSYVRGGGGRRASDKWWLDDGIRSWQVGELKPEHRFLPETTLVAVSNMADYISRGWNPNWEFDKSRTSAFRHPAKQKPRVVSASITGTLFLHFPSRSAADVAADEIRKRFRQLRIVDDEVEKDDDDATSVGADLVLEFAGFDGDMDELSRIESSLGELAARYDGFLDGNELPLA